MPDRHPSAPPPANARPVNSPEPPPPGGKGCLACLGLMVLLLVAGFLFRSSGPKPIILTPSQREELSRLLGNYEGVWSPQDGFAGQWANGWTARFSMDKSNQLKCQCVLTFYKKPARPDDFNFGEGFKEVVDVHYQDSERAGHIKIASGIEKERWSIYVETPVLKSGKEITSILLYDLENSESQPCILRRVPGQ